MKGTAFQILVPIQGISIERMLDSLCWAGIQRATKEDAEDLAENPALLNELVCSAGLTPHEGMRAFFPKVERPRTLTLTCHDGPSPVFTTQGLSLVRGKWGWNLSWDQNALQLADVVCARA